MITFLSALALKVVFGLVLGILSFATLTLLWTLGQFVRITNRTAVLTICAASILAFGSLTILMNFYIGLLVLLFNFAYLVSFVMANGDGFSLWLEQPCTWFGKKAL